MKYSIALMKYTFALMIFCEIILGVHIFDAD